MTYRQAIDYLEGLQMFGAKPGLERALALSAAVGNPHHRLRFIHVAGTNGKGSTCAMLESIYRQTGLKTGFFNSPHLVTFAERIQVNRKPISEADVVRLLTELQPPIERLGQDDHPTFFEVVTLMALRYFEEQGCELVLWETGLGGRLDATNIVTPLASILTNIHFDHEKWLGNTLPEIAFEKAGIIKPGVPVVTAAEASEALEVIERKARDCRSRLVRVTRSEALHGLAGQVTLPLLGEHQRLNAATAIAAVQVLQNVLPAAEEHIRRGLARVYWPGRLQPVKTRSGQQIILDGAHNPAGLEAMKHALSTMFPGQKPAIILGILRDKDWQQMCQMLASVYPRLLLVNVDSERTASAQELREACLSAEGDPNVTCHPNLADALAQAAALPLLAITGSLYLIGEAMELLGLSPAPPNGERGLNEWGGTPSPSGPNPSGFKSGS